MPEASGSPYRDLRKSETIPMPAPIRIAGNFADTFDVLRFALERRQCVPNHRPLNFPAKLGCPFNGYPLETFLIFASLIE
jgi:hypothetical protein